MVYVVYIVDPKSADTPLNKPLFIWNQLLAYYLVNSPDLDMKKLKEDMIDR